MSTLFIQNNTGHQEWYTPKRYIDAATKVLGTIDLDPASCEEANATVRATTYYNVEQDGLSKHWAGRVFMNPPYGSQIIGKFTKKLRQHYVDKDVCEAIVLTNNATETGWFINLANTASAIIFTHERIKFDGNYSAKESAPLQGQAIFYLGDNIDGFVEHFAQFGWVAYTSPVNKIKKVGEHIDYWL